MLHDIIKISHLCNTFHLQGISEPISEYSVTDMFCNILPSCDNFLPQTSNLLTNTHQAFSAPWSNRGHAAPSPGEHWASGWLVQAALIQQRFLINKEANHMPKCSLIDVRTATSIWLDVVNWEPSKVVWRGERVHFYPLKTAPPCPIFIIITWG